MKDHGYVENDFANARDIIRNRSDNGSLMTVESNQTVGEAIQMLHSRSISQLPVTDKEEFVGSLTDSKILRQLIENPELRNKPVSEVMDPPFQFVAMDNTLDVLSSLMNKDSKALLVRDENKQVHIITQHDLLMAVTQ
jgi:cystathionine beta-synthase